ncbi:SDR family oxidoreductase [Carboxylicivirga sp. N1Y90]|uniref:SDR family oxidoreductase n=1 Tax=Carboxylicivirga fragile TaxID=3417571 RepID=UPI003D3297EF|nr:SDR family oxidoreductase [Marinilabiliaceae bacterium N1Y90]
MFKRAFITGGAKRIGKGIVEFLASEGWSVVIHVNKSVDAAKELVAELNLRFPNQEFNMVSCDLVNWKESADFFEDIINSFGPVDLLINNASRYDSGAISEATTIHLEEMQAIHYFSPYMMGKVFKNRMKQGQIINILDASICSNATSYSAYLLAKKNMGDFTKMAALQWAPNFRVNAIAPGPVLPANSPDSSTFESAVQATPLQREVSLEDLCTALTYLINANSVTGQILFVDSGQHLL